MEPKVVSLTKHHCTEALILLDNQVVRMQCMPVEELRDTRFEETKEGHPEQGQQFSAQAAMRRIARNLEGIAARLAPAPPRQGRMFGSYFGWWRRG